MPVRKIPKNYRNLTGLLPSEKSVGEAGFESALERDVLIYFEFKSNVRKFEVQPVQIEWVDEQKRKRTYTPDVLVHFDDRNPIIYEIKYSQDLTELLNEDRDKFRTAIGFARKKGWRFKFFTEDKVGMTYLKNIRFLLPFLQAGPRVETDMDLIDDKLHELTESTPRQIITSIYADEFNQADLIPTLWYLVATEQIGINLHEPLTMISKIWSVR
ncbi:MAG: heteromeric transposase endonuclease subunit TnsA [Xanthomonadales bacterium]|nr:heteromeric transposase endonuclease subunit TnsA [Xanthomonadales bacterium]